MHVDIEVSKFYHQPGLLKMPIENLVMNKCIIFVFSVIGLELACNGGSC